MMISSTGNLQDNLRSTTKSHLKGRVRTALIVFQFTLTLFFIAFPLVAYFTIRWLQGFAYHISLQVWMFVLAAGCTVVLTLCTVGWHAIKASKTNPIETIKME